MRKVQVIPQSGSVCFSAEISYSWDHLHGLGDQDDLNDWYDGHDRGEWGDWVDYSD